MYNPKKVTPCFDLWGKPYYNTDQISDLVYSRMIENGSWKIVLTEGTKSGHVLKRNNDIIKLSDSEFHTRLFASWAMKNDGYQSWMLSRNEINKFNADEALSLFDKLARETDQFMS